MSAIRPVFWRILLALALVLAGCKVKALQTIPPADSADIYAAVIRQIAAEDGNQRAVLYVLKTTNDMLSRDDPNRVFQPIAEDVQQGVSERLKDGPTQIIWAANDAVPWENGAVKDGNAVITLDNLYPQDNGSVQAAVTLTFGNAGAFGKSYNLERKDGAWTVTGTTGPEWIS